MQSRGSVILNRIDPALPPQSYKTYGMVMPLRTHFRKATCAEVECDDWVMGFDSIVDITTELGRKQAHYILNDKTRSHTFEQIGPSLVKFHFQPGTIPFASPKHDHFVRMDRPPLFVVRGGDWRGNPRGTEPMVHRNADNWVDDFATHQDRLARAMN